MTFTRVLFCALAIAALASPAFAHPDLVSASPASGAKVTAPAKLELRFSEPVNAKFSGADVTATKLMVGGALVAKTAKVPGAVTVDPADPKGMILTFKSPLASGEYKVVWRTVGADTHRITGSYSFIVQ